MGRKTQEVALMFVHRQRLRNATNCRLNSHNRPIGCVGQELQRNFICSRIFPTTATTCHSTPGDGVESLRLSCVLPGNHVSSCQTGSSKRALSARSWARRKLFATVCGRSILRINILCN